MHQQDQAAAEPVGPPLLLHTARLPPAQDLKKLDQPLGEVIDAVGPDPGRADDHARDDFIDAVDKADQLLPEKTQGEFQLLIFQEPCHPWVILHPALFLFHRPGEPDAQGRQAVGRYRIENIRRPPKLQPPDKHPQQSCTAADEKQHFPEKAQGKDPFPALPAAKLIPEFLHPFLLSRTVKLLPRPGVLRTDISPSRMSMTRLTRASPRPLPSVAWEVSPW